jgi:hypothetical protein
VAEARARLAGDELPRDEVRVVLELGDHDVSPGRGSSSPQAYATRLIASVALRVKITSRSDGALMKRATVSRAPS